MAFSPTEEQVNCGQLFMVNDRLKVRALAGSGKSSTLRYIAEQNPDMSFLYLAFNKSMAEEAQATFPDNVEVRTVHSLAYRSVGVKYSHKLVRPSGRYVNVAGTGNEIALYYGIGDIKAGPNKAIRKAYLGLIAKDTVNRFERSNYETLTDKCIPKHYLEDIDKRFNVDIAKVKKEILDVAKHLWKDRSNENSRVLATHDTYLKLYSLSKPDLTDYDCVFVDEAQDSNPVTLSLFDNVKKIVYVGDERQAIYGWRSAVNAMKLIQTAEGRLSKSFRFGQAIADVAAAIIKEEVYGNENIESVVGEVDPTKQYTILYRKNLTLVNEAVDMILNGEKVYLNIDVQDFIAMLASAQALKDKDLKKVKHDLIMPFSTWSELTTEAKGDPSLGKLVKIIQEQKAQEVLNTLAASHRNPKTADVVMTTVHKSKGLEWDQVILAEDFDGLFDEEGRLTEDEQEINLMYVGATRAKKVLKINEALETLILMNKSDEDKLVA